jgi:hypothetical protein
VWRTDYNLNISRYISTAMVESEIDLVATHGVLETIEDTQSKRQGLNTMNFLKSLACPHCRRPILIRRESRGTRRGAAYQPGWHASLDRAFNG